MNSFYDDDAQVLLDPRALPFALHAKHASLPTALTLPASTCPLPYMQNTHLVKGVFLMSISLKLFKPFLFASTFFFCSTFIPPNFPFPNAGNLLRNSFASTLYISQVQNELASGVIHKNIQQQTSKGWQNIHLLQVDLKNPSVSIDAITSKEALTNLTPIDQLVREHKALAGINGGFFEFSKPSYPIGPLISNQHLRSMDIHFNEYGNRLSTFWLTLDKTPFIDFWTSPTRIIRTPKGISLPIEQFNKTSPYATDGFWMYDSLYQKQSPALPGTIEIFVENDLIQAIHETPIAHPIPQNGYVLITPIQNLEFVQNHLAMNMPLTFQSEKTPNLDEIQMAVTGSSPLILDGKIPTQFSFPIPGSHPRSAIGYDQKKETLYLVTVDGRQKWSVGMTLEELATFMLDLGCYEALNLDGGGSTSMAIQMQATEEDTPIAQVVNDPSDGAPRKISNGIGIFVDPSNITKNSSNGHLGEILSTENTSAYYSTTIKGPLFFKFAFLPPQPSLPFPFQQFSLKGYMNTLSHSVDSVVLLKPQHTASLKHYPNASLIHLDTSQNTLQTDTQNGIEFLTQSIPQAKKHLLIFISSHPNALKNVQERELFLSLLKDAQQNRNKTVSLIFPHTKNEIKIVNGIRTIGIQTTTKSNFFSFPKTSQESLRYLQVSLDEHTLTTNFQVAQPVKRSPWRR